MYLTLYLVVGCFGFFGNNVLDVLSVCLFLPLRGWRPFFFSLPKQYWKISACQPEATIIMVVDEAAFLFVGSNIGNT